MRRARSFARRSSALLLLLLLFWTASQLASRLPWIGALGTSVHALGLGDYTADPFPPLAPLPSKTPAEPKPNPEPPPASPTRPAFPTPPTANPDTDAYAYPGARRGHRDCRGQPDRHSNFRCDRHIGRSHHDDEWKRRVYFPGGEPRNLHDDRRRRPPLYDKHAVGECGIG